MRTLWLITMCMVVAGIAMAAASAMAGWNPIVLIGGVLLLWSGIVKAVVLRVWRTVLITPPLPEPVRVEVQRGETLVRQP